MWYSADAHNCSRVRLVNQRCPGDYRLLLHRMRVQLSKLIA
ncbi:hypothetical protein SAMN05192544_104464 [Paraburkholderia hospita]|jgi:hypothetical protein|nr:hypothetical protein SAMN05192544_104464 [Paraburkholderia hospita]SKC50147.1 hypothetical protein SAMN06266956_0331 [Paraburkholderia hospita]SKD05345.1 hypothetical protein SAMN05446934_9592 [Paraburkholderia hospita]